MTPTPDWDDMVLVGRIGRPHGVRGHVMIAPETDFVEERFRTGARFWTRAAGGDEQLTLSSARIQNGRPVVGFEGYSRIEDVEPLAGRELRVPENTLQPLGHGVYYHHHLVGCMVETTAGEAVGSVARVEGGAAGSLLAVDGARGEILIPLAADICLDIDVDARCIRIDPPEGLLDLNETKKGSGVFVRGHRRKTSRAVLEQ